jgi:hypothetical protein
MDEAEGVLKNTLLSNLIRDETEEEPSGSSTCRIPAGIRQLRSRQDPQLRGVQDGGEIFYFFYLVFFPDKK